MVTDVTSSQCGGCTLAERSKNFTGRPILVTRGRRSVHEALHLDTGVQYNWTRGVFSLPNTSNRPAGNHFRKRTHLTFRRANGGPYFCVAAASLVPAVVQQASASPSTTPFQPNIFLLFGWTPAKLLS